MIQKTPILLVILLLFASLEAAANGLNASISTGPSWGKTHFTQNLFLNSYVENNYATENTSSAVFANLSIGYRWKNIFNPSLPFDFNLAASGFYAAYNVAGVNSPLVNIGQFDTLNYQIKNHTYLLFVEPKLIYSHYRLQPYVLAGLGAAWNKASSYSEAPSDPTLSAAPMPQPFRAQTTTRIAYELGVGAAFLLYQTLHQQYLNALVDYRYIHAGRITLGTSPLQATRAGPDLGYLKIQLISVGLQYQFD